MGTHLNINFRILEKVKGQSNSNNFMLDYLETKYKEEQVISYY